MPSHARERAEDRSVSKAAQQNQGRHAHYKSQVSMAEAQLTNSHEGASTWHRESSAVKKGFEPDYGRRDEQFGNLVKAQVIQRQGEIVQSRRSANDNTQEEQPRRGG